jgi:hypothetical protein
MESRAISGEIWAVPTGFHYREYSGLLPLTVEIQMKLLLAFDLPIDDSFPTDLDREPGEHCDGDDRKQRG